MQVDVGVRTGADVRPIGCDVPLGQVAFRRCDVIILTRCR